MNLHILFILHVGDKKSYYLLSVYCICNRSARAADCTIWRWLLYSSVFCNIVITVIVLVIVRYRKWSKQWNGEQDVLVLRWSHANAEDPEQRHHQLRVRRESPEWDVFCKMTEMWLVVFIDFFFVSDPRTKLYPLKTQQIAWVQWPACAKSCLKRRKFIFMGYNTD